MPSGSKPDPLTVASLARELAADPDRLLAIAKELGLGLRSRESRVPPGPEGILRAAWAEVLRGDMSPPVEPATRPHPAESRAEHRARAGSSATRPAARRFLPDRSRPAFVVDGSNVCGYHPPRMWLAILAALKDTLVARWPRSLVRICVDAGFHGHLVPHPGQLTRFERLRSDRDIVQLPHDPPVAGPGNDQPVKSYADQYLFERARRHHAAVISNDRFDEWVRLRRGVLLLHFDVDVDGTAPAVTLGDPGFLFDREDGPPLEMPLDEVL